MFVAMRLLSDLQGFATGTELVEPPDLNDGLAESSATVRDLQFSVGSANGLAEPALRSFRRAMRRNLRSIRIIG
jgi:hypothetical protein